MNLSLAYSPCPNDTFMFYAIAHGKIDLRGHVFTISLHDVEHLNRMAGIEKYDISKMSFHAYALLRDRMELCDAGAALGKGNGPLLVCNRQASVDLECSNVQIALPGKHTTAALLMRYAFPHIKNYVYCLFHEVEKKVLNKEVQAGVLIHETRFLYARHGLSLLADLGEIWEKSTGLPIPLGGIAMSRKLPEDVRADFQQILRESVEYAMTHPEETMSYVRANAQEMDPDIMRKHIEMFVNDYSISMGEDGKRAVETLCALVKNS